MAEPSLALQIDEIAPGFLAPPAAAGPAPHTGNVAAASSDPTRDYYLEVYEEFMQVKEACGEATTSFTFEKFSRKLSKQTAEIKKKRPGVADVRFTVYVKDGKAALRAKVIKA
ncbi:MAG: hypothetical protein JKY37_18265 [Nannocystaceae bacterium]|nr:hypothetical protein [Nannocystaceae bacterium]